MECWIVDDQRSGLYHHDAEEVVLIAGLCARIWWTFLSFSRKFAFPPQSSGCFHLALRVISICTENNEELLGGPNNLTVSDVEPRTESMSERSNQLKRILALAGSDAASQNFIEFCCSVREKVSRLRRPCLMLIRMISHFTSL